MEYLTFYWYKKQMKYYVVILNMKDSNFTLFSVEYLNCNFIIPLCHRGTENMCILIRICKYICNEN